MQGIFWENKVLFELISHQNFAILHLKSQLNNLEKY